MISVVEHLAVRAISVNIFEEQEAGEGGSSVKMFVDIVSGES